MRRPSMVALAVSLSLAAACTADSPSAPPSALRPSRATVIAYPSCDPSGIRQAMASVYATTDLKKFAIPTFNRAEQFRQSGQTSQARTNYYAIVAHLLERYKNDLLLQPSGFADVQDAAFFIIASTIDCADQRQVDNLYRLVQAVHANEVRDMSAPANVADAGYQICPIVALSEEQPCAVPSGRAAVILPPGFVSREALLLMEPAVDVDGFFQADFGTIWSGRWRIRVEPTDAQLGTSDASVALCAEEQVFQNQSTDFHAPTELLQVARVREDDTDDVAELPPETDADVLDLLTACRGETGSSIGRLANPLGDGFAARYAWHHLRSTGDAIARALTPEPLYAFDGGIGGSLSLFASYFSAVEKPIAYIRRPASTELDGPITTETVPASTSKQVVASRTAWGIILFPDACTWSSSHNRIAVTTSGTGTATATATLTASRSAGEAIVTAQCTFKGEPFAPVDLTVTVTR